MTVMSALPISCAQCPRLRTAFYRSEQQTLVEMNELRTGNRHYPAKRTIYREGEPASEMLIIFDGWAFRYKLLPGGRRQILSFLLPGDAISMPLITSDRLPYSVQSLTAVTACSFERRCFADFVTKHDNIARQMESWCISAMAAADERLVDLGRRSAYERVGRLINDLLVVMEQKGIPTVNPIYFPLGQTHIADALGLTAIHAGRVLRRLRKEGVLSLHRGRLDVMDRAALRRL
ncbi:Crp/Fnr family transcriptional regulator [Dongia sp.]|uniref:Crp/Fnr family transcriptional regulator n=1 Tax=Dongia sp. TaxID=1977262 RepID=UPI0035B09A05